MLVYTDGNGSHSRAKIDPVQVSFIYAKAVEGLTWAFRWIRMSMPSKQMPSWVLSRLAATACGTT